jgi:hypothetical protein
MIDDQKQSELRWWAEREALVRVQKNRTTSRAELGSILQVFQATYKPSPDSDSVKSAAETCKSELAAFDRKIYDRLLAKNTAYTLELKAQGVPFFGTDPSLIVASDEDMPGDEQQAARPKWSPIITQQQFRKLQGKMIKHLEDLFGD